MMLMIPIEPTRPSKDNHSLPETAHSTHRNWPVWCVFFGCASAILLAVEHGYEGPFYRLTTLLHHPTTAEAPFGYRLLLPWLGLAMQAVRPSLSDHNVFIYTQILAIVAALLFTGEWTHIFLPRFGRPLAYLVATVMICPTIAYWTFYDNAIVAFWAGCLLLLYYERPVLFIVLLAIGTLNHENTLLLVPCALAYWWPTKSKGSVVLFGIAQVGAWATVRWLVVHFLPSGAIFDNHIWNNLHPSSMYTLGGLFLSVILLLPWWALAALGWKHSPYILKCAAISLPELIVITFLFGKFDEPRQFVAFIPACVGLIACWVGHELGKRQSVTDYETPEDVEQVA